MSKETIEFKDGYVVLDGFETTIPEEYWKEREGHGTIQRRPEEVKKENIQFIEKLAN